MLYLRTTSIVLISLALVGIVGAYDNGLALTPQVRHTLRIPPPARLPETPSSRSPLQMGWNTWNAFGCNINETIILNAARSIKSEGLDKLGYNYVIIDDCWQGARRDNTTGVIPADPVKFPSGLKTLVNEIHGMGLKAGIYSSSGTMTCGHHIGSLDHEQTDAQAWADDGFDYLKYDNCYNLVSAISQV
jgi:alpha-galactosidase